MYRLLVLSLSVVGLLVFWIFSVAVVGIPEYSSQLQSIVISAWVLSVCFVMWRFFSGMMTVDSFVYVGLFCFMVFCLFFLGGNRVAMCGGKVLSLQWKQSNHRFERSGLPNRPKERSFLSSFSIVFVSCSSRLGFASSIFIGWVCWCMYLICRMSCIIVQVIVSIGICMCSLQSSIACMSIMMVGVYFGYFVSLCSVICAV